MSNAKTHAQVDPDNPALTDAQLAQMRPLREVDPKLYQAMRRDIAGKTRITLYLDNDVLAEFRRRAGDRPPGYQTLINQALREYLALNPGPLDEPTLRRVLREELAGSQRRRKAPTSS